MLSFIVIIIIQTDYVLPYILEWLELQVISMASFPNILIDFSRNPIVLLFFSP
jgi:hypothetical protein